MSSASNMRRWWGLLTMMLAAPLVVDAIQFPGEPIAPQQARECLLSSFNTTTARDMNVFSQAGEDGILETIFTCIGTTSKRYVEFGVESGVECTTRNLRENHNFTGLMMDGSNSRPEVNLQKEFIYSYNIVQLFEKYNVPRPSFDQLTVDVDMNNFWVALAVLRGGYRPRSFTVEYNRNLAWDAEYATVEFPDDMWKGDCYYGATAGAYVNVMASFGYNLVAADRQGVNLFFIREDVVGHQPLLTLADVKRIVTGDEEHDFLHTDCYYHPWVKIPKGVDYREQQSTANLPVAMLSYKMEGQKRKWFEVQVVYPRRLLQKFGSAENSSIAESWYEVPERAATTVPATYWFVAAMIFGAVITTHLVWGLVHAKTPANPPSSVSKGKC